MNLEKPSREEIEAKLTALLLGELPVEEAQLLRWAISQDAALAKMHDRLKVSIGFVREITANPAEKLPAQTAPLKLSSERREKLLAHFKTVAPKEFAPPKQRRISPLLAMAAAVALIAVLAAMLLPALAAAKRKAQNNSAASLVMKNEMVARLAANKSPVDQNVPVASAPLAMMPPAASELRLESVEAFFQNSNPTVSPVSSRQSPTTIVLPPGGADGEELAVASPPPSGFFDSNFDTRSAAGSSVRDQQIYTIPMDSADSSAVAPVLQNMFGGSAVQKTGQNNPLPTDTASTFAFSAGAIAGGGGGHGGRGGGGVGTTFQQRFASINSFQAEGGDAVVFSGTTKQDGFDFDVTRLAQNQAVGGSEFFRSPVPASATDKVPMLGDVPLAGSLFKSHPASRDAGVAANTVSFDMPVPGAVVLNNGTLALADDMYQSTNGLVSNNSWRSFDGSTNGAAVLNGRDFFNTVTTVSSGSFALGAPETLGEELAHTADAQNRTVQVDKEFARPMQSNLPVAKDESARLAYNNSAAQLNRSRFGQSGTVGTAQISVDPDTHNLFVVSDAETMDQIRGMTKNLDQAPAATPPVGVSGTGRLAQNQADHSFAPAPIVESPATLTSATVVGYVNITNRIVLNQEAKTELQPQATTDEDRSIKRTPSPAAVATPEILTRENAFSTFSLNVSDVSFKLAAASLEKGVMPDAASIRSEEFINAFDYRDPEPMTGVPVAFVSERARDPFAHNRDLLRFSIKTAAAGRQPGRPLNIVLLLDNSGSMERADRVAIIHEALKVLAAQLQPQDTLSIVTFARTARLWVDGARGDQAGDAVSKVSDLTPEGGTNLEEAMNLAYATARRHYLANGVNRVVLLTDGAANLGNVYPEALKQKVETQRKQGIALDCFGIGWEGYNDDLLEVLSSNGDGRYGFINTPEAATTEFAAQLAGALHVAAEDVKVQVEFNPRRVVSYRQIGYAKHQLTKEQFRDDTVAAAPLAAREAGNALYTVEVNPQGEGPVATVRVRFRIPGTTDVSEHEWQVPFDGTAPALEKSSLAMRLAATSGAFSEWLESSPFAQEVTTDQLLNYLNGVPEIYGADARPKQLETMIREAKSLSGK
jgi:Mg-chelatase subunit ChlD/type II secretory pathway pseudopilin PulG